MYNSAETLVKRVRRILAENELSGRSPRNQLELAKAMKVSAQAITLLLKGEGKRGVMLFTLDRLAEALRIPPWELVGGPTAGDHPLEECIRRVVDAAKRGGNGTTSR